MIELSFLYLRYTDRRLQATDLSAGLRWNKPSFPALFCSRNLAARSKKCAWAELGAAARVKEDFLSELHKHAAAKLGLRNYLPGSHVLSRNKYFVCSICLFVKFSVSNERKIVNSYKSKNEVPVIRETKVFISDLLFTVCTYKWITLSSPMLLIPATNVLPARDLTNIIDPRIISCAEKWCSSLRLV